MVVTKTAVEDIINTSTIAAAAGPTAGDEDNDHEDFAAAVVTDRQMEDVASKAMKFATYVNEERERQELRAMAIQKHSPSKENLRQMQEATKRSQAEEYARIKHELEPQRQESERLQQLLAEESARIQAEHDLLVEKEQEKESKGEAALQQQQRTIPRTAPSSKLLVLYSPATASLKQRTEQDRSITILTAHGLGLKSQESEGKDFVEWIDATDPSQKERRSMLFDLSRLRGQYPQFFREIRKQHSGGNVIEFLGDFDWLDGLNESGTLSKGTLIGFDGRRPSNGANNIPTSDVTAGVSDATVSIATSGWTAPPTPTPYGGKSFVVLMSTFGSDVQQKTNQERLRTILAANGIVAVEVDASMPENKELRNELFEISGIRGNFPQVFVEDDDFNYTYIGGLDKIEALNDCSAILSVLGHDEGQAIDQDDGRGSGREREYEMNVDEYENERLGNSDHGVPPSLASATSSNGWYDAADEMIQVEDGDNKTETKDETTKIAPPPGGFQIVSDHAAGHGDLDADSQKEIKSDLSSGIFTPQVGLAVAAVVAGIAVWVSRGR